MTIVETIARALDPTAINMADATEVAQAVLTALDAAGMVVVRGEDRYDFIGAYMSDPECFKQLDHDGQLYLAKSIAANIGYVLAAAPEAGQ